MAIVVVILIFAFFIIMDMSVENSNEKKKKEREEKEKKAAQELKERFKQREKLYKLALKIGEVSGISYLRRITIGFRIIEDGLTPEQQELSDAATRAMETLTTEPNYSMPPPIPQEFPEPFNYDAPWWKNYSVWYRDENKWICEVCELDLNYDKQYLHTHHIYGTQRNKPKDLKALCIGCHAEQDRQGHTRLKTELDYKTFMKKYGKQRENTLKSFQSLSIQFKKDLEALKQARTFINSGITKARLRQYGNAIKDYDNAIRLMPDYASAYYNRGLAKSSIEQYENAIADYDTAICLRPDYPAAYNNRGVAKHQLGQYADAITDYDTAIKLKPDYPLVSKNREIAKCKMA